MNDEHVDGAGIVALALQADEDLGRFCNKPSRMMRSDLLALLPQGSRVGLLRHGEGMGKLHPGAGAGA
jgi:hypothetical protein